MDFVCVPCGKRQAAGEKCAACGEGDLLDLRKEETRGLLFDIDQRRTVRREGHIRVVGVVVGIALVVGLWTVPGYWETRMRSFALPVLLDQWLLMIAIAYGATKLLELRWSARPKYPFVDRTGQLVD